MRAVSIIVLTAIYSTIPISDVKASDLIIGFNNANDYNFAANITDNTTIEVKDLSKILPKKRLMTLKDRDDVTNTIKSWKLTAVIGNKEDELCGILKELNILYMFLNTKLSHVPIENVQMLPKLRKERDLIMGVINRNSFTQITIVQQLQRADLFETGQYYPVRTTTMVVFNGNESVVDIIISFMKVQKLDSPSQAFFLVRMDDRMLSRVFTAALFLDLFRDSVMWLVISDSFETSLLEQYKNVPGPINFISPTNRVLSAKEMRAALLTDAINTLREYNATKGTAIEEVPKIKLEEGKSQETVEFENRVRIASSYYLFRLNDKFGIRALATWKHTAKDVKWHTTTQFIVRTFTNAGVNSLPVLMNYSLTTQHGYAQDLFKELSTTSGFVFIQSQKSYSGYGLLNSQGRWTGLVSGLVSGDIDIAINAMNVFPERRAAVSFSVPLYYSGYNGLFYRPKRPFFIAQLITPFSSWVWIAIIVSFFISTFVLFAMDKISPNEEGKSMYNLPECLYLNFAGLVMAKLDVRPIKLSARLFYLITWFGSLMYVFTFAASTTATFALREEYTPFKSLEEMYHNTDGYYWVFVRNGATEMNFANEDSVIMGGKGHIYHKIYHKAKKEWPEKMYVASSDVGGQYFRQNQKAVYIADSITNSYLRTQNCDELAETPVELHMGVALGISKQMSNDFVNEIDSSLEKLRKRGKIYSLQQKWFRLGLCEMDETPASAPVSLQLTDLAGIFLLVAFGVVAGLINVIGEYTAYVCGLSCQRGRVKRAIFGDKYAAKVKTVTPEGIWIRIDIGTFFLPNKYLHSDPTKKLTAKDLGINVNSKIDVQFRGNDRTTGLKIFKKMR